MSNKIKVIDLLNKIANGEEVPKEIKKEDLEGNSFEDLIDNLKYFDKDFSKTLNDEVEILEDNTEEIEELDTDKGLQEIDRVLIIQNRNKINELVKAVNDLRKEKTDET